MARPQVLQSIDQNALDIDTLEAEMYEKLSAKQDLINGTEVTVLAKDEIKIGDVVYTVENGFDFLNDINISSSNYIVNSISFSPDGNTLVIAGGISQTEGYAKVYSVNGNTITYISDIYSDNNSNALDSTVDSSSFSPDGNTLVLGGAFTGRAKIYSVNGTTITYISDIDALFRVWTLRFSPDGNILILGGSGSKAKVYSVNGTTITYVSDVYADNNGTALGSGGYVNSIAFSPDGNTLVIGGENPTFAKVYSVSGTTITYISDIYADGSNTALNYSVQTLSFSPDGKMLVLGGGNNSNKGYAKIYSVNGNTITYISDIYSDNGTTVLNNNVRTVVFSPDGNTLIIGGVFTGKAKVYSVNGNTITYISDIYSDNNNTALNSYVYSVAFSPDGNTLVLGVFSNSKVYTTPYISGFSSTNPDFNETFYGIAIAEEDIVLNTKGIIRKIISVDNSQLSKKPLTASSILSSSGWDGNVYSFESDFPKSIYDIEIEINGDNCTSEQLEAWSGAQLVGSAISNSCKAMGDVPTIDIPIIIKVVVK